MNIIQGENGQGKTNLMEAIYILGTTKSFRPLPEPSDLIAEEQSACSLKGCVENSGRVHEFFFRIEQGGGKSFGRADSTEDLYDYIGVLDTLAFTGEHLSIVRGGPEERRKFIDRGIVGVKTAYLKTLVEYRRAVRQKNRFLADSARGFAGKNGGFLIELEAWNERIIDLGSRILLERATYVSRLNDLLQEIHSGLFSGARPPVGMTLRTAIGDEGSIAGEGLESVSARLKQKLESAAPRSGNGACPWWGRTATRSSFRYGGRLLRQYGLSGQQRGTCWRPSWAGRRFTGIGPAATRYSFSMISRANWTGRAGGFFGVLPGPLPALHRRVGGRTGHGRTLEQAKTLSRDQGADQRPERQLIPDGFFWSPGDHHFPGEI